MQNSSQGNTLIRYQWTELSMNFHKAKKGKYTTWDLTDRSPAMTTVLLMQVSKGKVEIHPDDVKILFRWKILNA